MNFRGARLGVVLSASVFLTAPVPAVAQVAPSATAEPPRQLPSGLTKPDTAALQQELARLHAELTDLTVQKPPTDPGTGDSEVERLAQIARLRARVQELVLRIKLQRAAKPTPAAQPSQLKPVPTPSPVTPVRPPELVPPPSPAKWKPPPDPTEKSTPPAAPASSTRQFALPPAGIGKAVDPWALAQALFESHDYEDALKAYRALESEKLSPADHITVQYMIACCLRNLGKANEAATMYREVANSRDNDMLADCARWQLNALRWRQDLAAQLAACRQRRQALETKP